MYFCITHCIFRFIITDKKKNKLKKKAIVVIFWDNCSKILGPNLNDEYFEKINIKTAMKYNNIFLCQITVFWRIPDCETKFGQKKEWSQPAWMHLRCIFETFHTASQRHLKKELICKCPRRLPGDWLKTSPQRCIWLPVHLLTCRHIFC